MVISKNENINTNILNQEVILKSKNIMFEEPKSAIDPYIVSGIQKKTYKGLGRLSWLKNKISSYINIKIWESIGNIFSKQQNFNISILDEVKRLEKKINELEEKLRQ